MKLKTKSTIKKRITVTKTGKIKRMQAARSHLRRNKSPRSNILLDLSKSDKSKVRLFNR